MGKSVNNNMLDAMLNYLANNCTRIDLCSAEPTTYAAATSTYTLGNAASLTSGNFTGPADGDTSGRKITVDALSAVSIGSSGTVTHLGYTDGVSELIMVNTTGSQGVSSGGTADVSAHDAEVADPT